MSHRGANETNRKWLAKTREDLAAAIVAEASIKQGETVLAYPYSSGYSRSPPVAHTYPCREGSLLRTLLEGEAGWHRRQQPGCPVQ